jgi:hypothetical protein
MKGGKYCCPIYWLRELPRITPLLLLAQVATGVLRINEVAYRGTTDEFEVCGREEWIELANTGSEAVDLFGYTLQGETGRSSKLNVFFNLSARTALFTRGTDQRTLKMKRPCRVAPNAGFGLCCVQVSSNSNLGGIACDVPSVAHSLQLRHSLPLNQQAQLATTPTRFPIRVWKRGRN